VSFVELPLRRELLSAFAKMGGKELKVPDSKRTDGGAGAELLAKCDNFRVIDCSDKFRPQGSNRWRIGRRGR
jgi:hypothetical protein